MLMLWRVVGVIATIIIIGGQLMLLGCIPGLAADPLVGRATVIDGDTIEIHGERVRFNGIDAPESAQLCRNADGTPWRCGQKSSLALDDWLAESRPTHCEFVERDQYGRFIGACYRADGASVSKWLVREGCDP